jgi:hypothetical protein
VDVRDDQVQASVDDEQVVARHVRDPARADSGRTLPRQSATGARSAPMKAVTS